MAGWWRRRGHAYWQVGGWGGELSRVTLMVGNVKRDGQRCLQQAYGKCILPYTQLAFGRQAE